MTAPRVVVADIGGANLASVAHAFDRLRVRCEISSSPKTIEAASHVVLPGVGAAGAAMKRLRASGLDRLIPKLTQPVLGICLGMQLLYEHSDEDDVDCLGVLAGTVGRLSGSVVIPHMGWNDVRVLRPSPLAPPDGTYVYYTHSYRVLPSADTIAETTHGETFAAIVQDRNFFGMQFHPERSGRAGAALLSRFVEGPWS